MKASVRTSRTTVKLKRGVPTGGITVKRLGKNRSSHVSGTVVMKTVSFGKSILGTVVEENEFQILPRSRDMLAVSNWPTARFVGSLGGYIDTDTHQVVKSAKFVYVSGEKIYYWQ